MKLHDIRDPNLVRRIQNAMNNARILEKEIALEIPKLAKARKRLRQDTKPLMNKLEQEYYDTFLENSGGRPVMIQSVRFKLGNGIWYKPDFVILSTICSSTVAIEVKGPHAFRGGFENLKIAANQYPWIKWVLVWKENDQWQEQKILP